METAEAMLSRHRVGNRPRGSSAWSGFHVADEGERRALRHAIARPPESGAIDIAARVSQQVLAIEVANDTDELAEIAADSNPGVGLANTRSRLFQLYGQSAARLKLCGSSDCFGVTGDSCPNDFDVVLDAAPTGTNRPDDHVTFFHGFSAAEDDDLFLIGGVQAKKRLSRLGGSCNNVSCHIERTCRPSFVDRDIHTAEPGTVHPNMGNQTTACIYHRYVVRNPKFLGLFFARRNDQPGICERECGNFA
jgi:hypothetical protein